MARSQFERKRFLEQQWQPLMSLPVDRPDRNQLHDVVRGTDAQVIRRAAKYLTLAKEYAARRRPNPLHEPLPTYADWLVRVCGMSRKDAERQAARENAEHRALADLERRRQSETSAMLHVAIVG